MFSLPFRCAVLIVPRIRQLYIGDTERDVLAAQAAGCRGAITVVYDGGAGAKGQAERWGGDAVVRGIEGLAVLAPALLADLVGFV